MLVSDGRNIHVRGSYDVPAFHSSITRRATVPFARGFVVVGVERKARSRAWRKFGDRQERDEIISFSIQQPAYCYKFRNFFYDQRKKSTAAEGEEILDVVTNDRAIYQFMLTL